MSVVRSEAGLALELLLEEPSGVAFIHRCLRRLARAASLQDALLVFDDEVAGRQAFRLGGRGIDDAWTRRVAFYGPPGLHTRPRGAVSPTAAEGLSALAKVAWRMETLRHQARVDPLTGLLNRHGLREHFEQATERHRRYREPFGLMIADIDRFKAVNDRFGHPAGDRLLQLVANSLGRTIRGIDVAARIGGDEFAVLLAGARAGEITQVRDRFADDLPGHFEGFPVSVSVGTAACPDDGTRIDVLLEVADRRLYEGKAAS